MYVFVDGHKDRGIMRKVHEYAAIFPLIEGPRFDELCADIQINGLTDDIICLDGFILDGVNRDRACDAVGRPQRYKEYHLLGLKMDPIDYVWSKNGARRHLKDIELATARLLLEKKRAEMGEPTVATRVAKAKSEKVSADNVASPRRGKSSVCAISHTPKPTERAKPVRTSKVLAKEIGVKEYAVRQARAIVNEPGLAERVVKGEVSAKDALHEIAAKKAAETAPDELTDTGEAVVSKGVDAARAAYVKADDAIRAGAKGLRGKARECYFLTLINCYVSDINNWRMEFPQ